MTLRRLLCASRPTICAARHYGLVLSLEDLAETIHSHQSRVQFGEVIRAYRAGAYKSATIVLWISVIQDFTDKVRILAEGGDAVARSLIDDLDKARLARDLKKLQSFENTILSNARDVFELVTHREAVELDRLYADRNSCAHPTFQSDVEEPFEMTEEQVRAHARVVVGAVLGQLPTVGKALVIRFQNDVKGESWPDDHLSDYLRNRYFSRARGTAMRGVLTAALKVAIRPGEESNTTAGRCVAALQASAGIDRQLVDEVIRTVLTRWRDGMSDADLVRALGAVGAISTTWVTLGDENAQRIGILLGGDIDFLIGERAFASGVPSREDLRVHYRRAIDRLTTEQIGLMTRRPYETSQWVGPALANVGRVRSWRGGEEAFKTLVRLAGDFTVEDLHVIADCFSSNQQISRAADMPQLLFNLVEGTSGISGSAQVWLNAIERYRETYSSETDPNGYYSYQTVLDRLNE